MSLRGIHSRTCFVFSHTMKPLVWGIMICVYLCISCTQVKYEGKHSFEDEGIIYPKPFAIEAGDTIAGQSRYHSAYHTDNPFYDGLNLILDGLIKEGEKVLNDGLESTEEPWRSCLLIYICKCIEGDRKGADKFLKSYVDNNKLDPNDGSAVATTIKYFIGSITEKEFLLQMRRWDDAQDSIGYFYYGMYKKYHEEDITNGNLNISKALLYNNHKAPEYRIAEKEIKGYTPRFNGRYKDFPVVQAPYSEPGFLTPLDEQGNPSINDLKSYLPSYMQTDMNQNPPQDNFPLVLPSPIGGLLSSVPMGGVSV